MNNDKIKQFMSNLSKGTLSGNIHWKRVTDFGDLKPESTNPFSIYYFNLNFGTWISMLPIMLSLATVKFTF